MGTPTPTPTPTSTPPTSTPISPPTLTLILLLLFLLLLLLLLLFPLLLLLLLTHTDLTRQKVRSTSPYSNMLSLYSNMLVANTGVLSEVKVNSHCDLERVEECMRTVRVLRVPPLRMKRPLQSRGNDLSLSLVLCLCLLCVRVHARIV